MKRIRYGLLISMMIIAVLIRGMLGIHVMLRHPAQPTPAAVLMNFAAETSVTVSLNEPGFNDIQVTRIDNGPGVYCIVFQYADSNTYTFGMYLRPEDLEIGIWHGMKDENGNIWSVKREEDGTVLFLCSDGRGFLVWWENGRCYFISMEADAAEASLRQMREIIRERMKPMPAEQLQT